MSRLYVSVRYKRLRDKSMRLLTAEDTNTFKSAASPASCAADRSPATSPSTTTAKHIWTANNSFRFLRLALLLRLFSITPPPPPTAVSGIPSTTTRAMALFVPAEQPVVAQRSEKLRRERRHGEMRRVRPSSRYDRPLDGFVKLFRVEEGHFRW